MGMKIIALDIGAGTEDVLLFDNDKGSLENCVKMVLPSPSKVFASKVKEATNCSQDIFLTGDVIGGGVLSGAIRSHLHKGLKVFANERAAFTIRNDLDEVRELGIEVIPETQEPKNFEDVVLKLEEINLQKLDNFLKDFNESLSGVDFVAIAVQDHGISKQEMSNRQSRMQNMKALLKDEAAPEKLAFKEDEVSPYFLRMQSAVQASRRQLPEAQVLVMDTAPAAILGCLKDPVVEKKDHIIALNIGNGHTMAAIISKAKIQGLMEHHTCILDSKKLEQLVLRFANGDLTNEEVFREGGHGLFYLTQPPGFSQIDVIAVTGPNRKLASKTNFPNHFAAPGGDMMMTGPIGLVEATYRKFNKGK
jgi:uncharacterized protein (DUF1786 family)